MAVVFSGLLLTAGLIVVFGKLQGILDRAGDEETPAPAATPVAVPVASDAPPVDPEVLTVIATVLEVEHRLHRIGRSGGERT